MNGTSIVTKSTGSLSAASRSSNKVGVSDAAIQPTAVQQARSILPIRVRVSGTRHHHDGLGGRESWEGCETQQCRNNATEKEVATRAWLENIIHALRPEWSSGATAACRFSLLELSPLPKTATAQARVDLDYSPPSSATAARLRLRFRLLTLRPQERHSIPTGALTHDGRQDGRLHALHRPEAWHVRH